MKEKGNFKKRLLWYFVGLFIMTMGISVSVKSDLGVSPGSSIPYTVTRVWGLEMGKATILFHVFLVLIELAILRKKFRLRNLLQVGVGIVFGYFTTFCNTTLSFLPAPQGIVPRVFLMFVSAFLLALGIFFYMPTDILPVASEGCLQVIAEAVKRPVSRVKVAYDSGSVIISLVTCLLALHSLGSVGIGTVILALSVGTIHGWLTKHFGAKRDRLIGIAG